MAPLPYPPIDCPADLVGMAGMPHPPTESIHKKNVTFYTMPCAIIALATLRKPATLAPRT